MSATKFHTHTKKMLPTICASKRDPTSVMYSTYINLIFKVTCTVR